MLYEPINCIISHTYTTTVTNYSTYKLMHTPTQSFTHSPTDSLTHTHPYTNPPCTCRQQESLYQVLIPQVELADHLRTQSYSSIHSPPKYQASVCGLNVIHMIVIATSRNCSFDRLILVCIGIMMKIHVSWSLVVTTKKPMIYSLGNILALI